MIVNIDHLPAIRAAHKDESLVFAHGAYDVLHIGHVGCLDWSSQQGDKLVVGISTDERIRQRKGPSRPIYNQASRLAIVSSLRAVDYAFLTEGEYDPEIPASLTAAKLLRPDVVILSDDCSANEELVWQKTLADTQAQIVRHPESLRVTSTTEIIRVIKES